MGYSNQVKLIPFSNRYRGYYNRCVCNRINCLEGAYRAGKSVINIFSFANYLDNCEDKIHLVSGASASSARLNVADCNGLGLTAIFRGRCKSGKYEGNDCLKIDSKRGMKIVIFVGGGQSDSYKKIQGLSFGSWLSVELANLYISNDEKCFIDMALSRLTQSKLARVWWDLNPVYPTHPVYVKYLDKFAKMQETGEIAGGYNYMQCSLFDNTSLSKVQLNEALSLYPDENSMEYQRYILGKRACAEGLIFSMFAKKPSDYTVENISAYLNVHSVQFISIGVDFGGNGSDTTAVATIISDNYRYILPYKDKVLLMSGGEKDVSDFRDFIKDFITSISENEFGIPLRYIFADSADPVLVNEIRSVVMELALANNVRVVGSVKQTIKDRINTKKAMLVRGYWQVYKDAKFVINSTSNQVWSNAKDHEDERLDNGSKVYIPELDIKVGIVDFADAEEYSWSAFIDKILFHCK